MFTKLASWLRQIAGGYFIMAGVFIAYAAMAVPLGVVILIERPDWESVARWLVYTGIISFIIGFGFTIKDEALKRKENEQRRKEREYADMWREEQDGKRKEEHYLYRLVLYEVLRGLGVNPRFVGIRYKRWLEEERRLREERKRKEEYDL